MPLDTGVAVGRRLRHSSSTSLESYNCELRRGRAATAGAGVAVLRVTMVGRQRRALAGRKREGASNGELRRRAKAWMSYGGESEAFLPHQATEIDKVGQARGSLVLSCACK